MAEYANKHRRPHQFVVDDKVWLSTKTLSLKDGAGSRKLYPKICRPFVIKKKVNDVSFRLEISEPVKLRGIHDIFHVRHLKPYTQDLFCREPQPEPAVLFDDFLKKVQSNKYYLIEKT